jgi:hypothetical protein
MAVKAIIGGGLMGLGTGMVAQAETKRQEALERVRQMREDTHRGEDKTFQLERDRSSREFQTERDKQQGGLLSRVEPDAEGNLMGITRDLQTKDLGIKQPLSTKGGLSGSGDGDELGGISMGAEEKRLYDEVKARYTDARLNTVDWQGFIGHLRDMPEERGGARWNEIADHLTGQIGVRMSRGEAREKAVAEARQRKGYLSSRSSEFPETEGDEQSWIEMRTDELMGASGGTGSGLMPGRGQQEQESSQIQSGQSASGSPPGGGTQGDPYKATTQSHIDWFLESAPGGAVIEADGQLYTK